MPTPAYLTITGDPIKSDGALSADSVGGFQQKNHTDECLIVSCQHEVLLPTDPTSGQPVGNRKHGNLVLTKLFDGVSPLLYQALCEGIKFDAELKWFRIADDGSNEHYFTMAMTNAVVVNMEIDVPLTLDPANKDITHLEKVSLRYDDIEWRHEISAISYVDSYTGTE